MSSILSTIIYASDYSVKNSTSKIAVELRKYFPSSVSIHGATYTLNEISCSPQNLAQFSFASEKVNTGLGPALRVYGKIKLTALPKPFKVINGAFGRKYMLFLQAFLVSPSGSIVWQQQSYPQGDAWVNASGETKDFLFIQSYQGQTAGHTLVILAAGDPILNDIDAEREKFSVRVIIGVTSKKL